MKATQTVIFGLLLTTLIACRQNTSPNFDKLIIGEWTFVEEPPKVPQGELYPPPKLHTEAMKSGYAFFVDGSCEYKPGFFKRIGNNQYGNLKTYFLGTTSTYKVEGDSLKIFNLTDSNWTSIKIFNIKSDTLTLQYGDNTFMRYSRSTHYVQNNLLLDQIVVSASGCFGTCPVNNISISKTGQVVYYGDEYNTVNGFYTAMIDSTKFTEIVSRFNKARIELLDEHYVSDWTDDETVSVTFVKDNRIVKTITDYGGEAPIEFYWAYTPVRYLYQQIPLDTIRSIPIDYFFHNCTFTSKERIIDLSQSEGFLLWNLLINSPETHKEFSSKYTLTTFSRSKGKLIVTDGRFYKFDFGGGKTKAYDLGFDFIAMKSRLPNF